MTHSNRCSAWLLGALLMLSACGGGGGGGAGNPPPAAQTFTIGGTVSGLAGTLVLQNNGANDRTLNADGAFIFTGTVSSGGAFSVTIVTQPPAQTCTVAGASGTAAANISNVAITCVTNTFTVGGTVTGLVGGMVLQNNAGDDLTIGGNGAFTFVAKVNSGAAYNITLRTPPELQTCTVSGGSGTARGDVADVSIRCADVAPPVVSLDVQPVGRFRFNWAAVAGATHYRLFEAPIDDLFPDFTQAGDDLGAAATEVVHQAPLLMYRRARFKLQACGVTRCIDSNEVRVNGTLEQAIGYIKAGTPVLGDEFGRSVALSEDGSTLAVGVPFNGASVAGTPNALPDSGAVYVYQKTNGQWSLAVHVKATNPDIGDNFGTSVALSGDGSYLAVGAPHERSSAIGVGGDQSNDSLLSAGAVYVYHSSGGVWALQAYVKASNTGAGDEFGTSVALDSSGRTLAVGAPREDGSARIVNGLSDNLAIDAGAVYVYRRAEDAWRPAPIYIKAFNTDANDTFGRSIVLSPDGSKLAVGAPGEDGSATEIDGADNNLAPSSGAVYLFGLVALTAAPEHYVKALNAGSNDGFGTAVALPQNGFLAVGAPGEDSARPRNPADNSAEGAGAAYVFDIFSAPGASRQVGYFKAETPRLGDRFGTSVALNLALFSGPTLKAQIWLAVGADGDDGVGRGIDGDRLESGERLDSGAVHLFVEGGFSRWEDSRVYLKAPNADRQDAFGISVAMSGTWFNPTLAVGASGEQSLASRVGGDQQSNADDRVGAVYAY